MDDHGANLLQYARFHGLSRDYTAAYHEDIIGYVKMPENILLDLADPEDAPTIEAQVDYAIAEKLSLSTNAKQLLASTILLESSFTEDDYDSFQVQPSRVLKLDLPLLRTDPEIDLQSFRRSIKMNELALDMHSIEVDEQNDEGLSWPDKTLSLPSKYDHLSITEKLEIPKISALWMRDTLADTFTVEDSEAAFSHAIPYKKNHALDHTTPPLLPLTPPRTSRESSFVDVDLEYLSDGISPIEAELSAIEKRLLLDDETQPPNADSAIGFSESRLCSTVGEDQQITSDLWISPPTSSSPLRARASRLKIEIPLTPVTSVSQVKRISWSDELVQLIPNLATTLKSSDDPSEDDLEDFFNNIIEPTALKADAQLHHEELQEADCTKRVPVPVMDFSIPEPVWKRGKHREMEKEDTKEIILLIAKMKCHYWSVSKIERELPWSPFTSQMKIFTIEEELEEDKDVADILRSIGLEDAVDIETLTWKPEGLRILDEDGEEEEELQPSSYRDPSPGIDGLIQKRKRALDVHTSGIGEGLEPLVHVPAGSSKNEARSTHSSLATTNLPNEKQFNTFFSATSELDRFMSIQTGITTKKTKLTPAAPLPKPAPAPLHEPLSKPVQTPDSSFKVVPNPEFPHPPLTQPSTAPPIIVSSTLLIHRHHLIRHITRLYPPISLIERGTIPTALTVDFIISPSTSLICTNLQEIKQKPLPGQSSHSPIHARISSSAPAFERLVVLVSSGRDSALQDQMLEERDCAALNDLVHFATAMDGDTDVTVTFVAGGEEDLARWILGLICAIPPPQMDLVLLPEVTLWELFLTQAGMNAFAAQAVLSAVNAPDQGGGGGEQGEEEKEKYGLGAFVVMDAEERVKRFERVVGGRKVLRRVGRVLDNGWRRD